MFILKKLFIFSIVILSLSNCGGLIHFNQPEQRYESENTALSAIYESVEELYDHSNLIVTGKIDGNYKEFVLENNSEQMPVYRQYNLEVDKVLSNTSGIEVNSKDNITLNLTLAYVGNYEGGKTITYVSNPESYEIQEGNYLWFLNGYYHTDLNQYVFTTNSPNHLYKESNGKFVNLIDAGVKKVTVKEVEKIVKRKESREN